MKPYPKYKPSGIHWLGNVPEHWDVKRVKHLGLLSGGAGFPVEEQGSEDGPIPFFKVKDLNGAADKSGVIRETNNYVDEDTAARLRATVFPEGSIVFAKVGAALLLARFRTLGIAACIDNNMMGFVPDESQDQRFLVYALSTINMNLMVNPGTVPSVNETQVGNWPNLIPRDRDEQSAIAAYLDTETARIDILVAEKGKLIDLLREYRQSVITEAVTKGLNPDVPMKESGVPWLGDVPAHWQVLSLRRALEGLAVNGVFKKGEDFGEGALLVNVTDLFQENFVVDTEKLERVRCDESETQRYGVNEGDLFLVRSSLKLEGIARFAIVQAIKEETVFECHVVRMRPDAQKGAPMFLAYYLNSSFARQSLVSRAKTTTMTTIDQSEALATPLLLPPPTEQTAIAAYLDTQTVKIDELIAHVQQEIELLKELRSSTVTDAVLGRIDLRDYTKKNKQDKSRELQPAL